jgi:hypothetical protein
LVFGSSFFSGIGAASFMGSPGLVSPAGGAAGSAGAVGAGAGGGGGGAGSSFLPHPTNVRVNAKRVTADNETSFFPMLIHLLSRHTFTNFCVKILYRTSRREFQAQMPAKLISARSDFSRRCWVVGDLFRRQKNVGLRTYQWRRRKYFSERLAARKQFPWQFFTIKRRQ